MMFRCGAQGASPPKQAVGPLLNSGGGICPGGVTIGPYTAGPTANTAVHGWLKFDTGPKGTCEPPGPTLLVLTPIGIDQELNSLGPIEAYCSLNITVLDVP